MSKGKGPVNYIKYTKYFKDKNWSPEMRSKLRKKKKKEVKKENGS